MVNTSEQSSVSFREGEIAGNYSTWGMGLLNLFPDRLQDKTIHDILRETYERATDIWYKAEDTGLVWVMRYNLQWQLNEIASSIWLQIEEKPIKKILDQTQKEFPDIDVKQLQFHFAEFLLCACTNGLISLAQKEKAG